jgi:hypothetical protein
MARPHVIIAINMMVIKYPETANPVLENVDSE